MWSRTALAAHGVRVRGIVILELVSQSGCGKSDNQGGCEEELLHDESPSGNGLRIKAFQPAGQDVRVKHDK